MTPRTFALAAVVSTSAFLAACTVQSTKAAPGGSSSGGAGDGGASVDAGAAAQPLTCIGILQCAAKCANNDDACANACVSSGASDAQTAVTALAQCYQDNACQDATCAQSKCKSQLDACLNASAPPPAGQPSSGNAPPQGNIPANLVGSWSYLSPGGTKDELDFNADGSARYSTAQESSGTCGLMNILQYSGPAVIDATTITVYGNEASLQMSACGSNASQPQPARTIVFGYSMDTDATTGGPVLVITDQDCIQKNGQASYCYARYTRM